MRVSVSVAVAVAVSCAMLSAQENNGQPNLTAPKIDFVAGEKVVFFDDFSDMAAEAPPPHWKVRDGKVDLRTGGNVRELVASGDGVNLTSPTIAVPKNFTFEVVWTGGGEMDWQFRDKDGQAVMTAMVRGEEDGKSASAEVDAGDKLGDGMIDANTDQPVVFALWAQEGRVRAYLNGQRLVDANQVELAPITQLYVEPSRYRPNGIRSVRLAESSPDFLTVFGSSGKYVSHAITFDTDSDRLRPESAGVLKMIAGALTKDPTLKVAINGYTDSTGDAAHNLDLSKRRAAAVRSVLVSQFGVSGSRLTFDGFGASNPIGSNDTPAGRTQNRRVEFLKQ